MVVVAAVVLDTAMELLVEVDAKEEERSLLCSMNVEPERLRAVVPFEVVEPAAVACHDQLNIK